MLNFPDPHPNLLKWPVWEAISAENLYPQFQDAHIEDLDLSMVAIPLSAVEVVFDDFHGTGRCKVLRNHRTLTGRIYSRLTDAINDIRQTYDPPAPEPLPTTTV